MFKFVSVFATIFTIAHFLSIPTDDDYNWMEKDIIDALELSRNNTPDPFILDDFETDLILPSLTAVLGFSDASVNGSAGFEIEKVSFDLDTWQANIVMNYPQLNSSSNKYAHITIGDLSLDLDISENVGITDFLYEYKYRLVNGTDNKVYVKDWWLQMTVGNIDYKMSAQFNGIEFGDKLSQLINEYGAKFINDHKEIISDVLSAIIQFIIDITQNRQNELH